MRTDLKCILKASAQLLIALVSVAAIIEPCAGQLTPSITPAARKTQELLQDECLNPKQVVLLVRILSIQEQQRRTESLVWFDIVRAVGALQVAPSLFLLPQVATIDSNACSEAPVAGSLHILVVEARPFAPTQYAIVQSAIVGQDEIAHWSQWFNQAADIATKKRNKLMPELLSRHSVRAWSQNVVVCDNPQMVHNLELHGFDKDSLESIDTKKIVVAWVDFAGSVYPDPPDSERSFPRITRQQRVKVREVFLGETPSEPFLQVDTEDRAIEVSRALRKASDYDGPHAILQWGNSFLTCIDLSAKPPRIGRTLKLLGPEDPVIVRVREIAKKMAK